ncbi:hypothetical protein JTL79_34815, partial [Pseudomonas aeruginosa]|nr:hypothetical protein [Pseudomonas aeruginosa]
SGISNGLVGPGGEVYVSGVDSGEKLQMKWGETHQQSCEITLPELQLDAKVAGALAHRGGGQRAFAGLAPLPWRLAVAQGARRFGGGFRRRDRGLLGFLRGGCDGRGRRRRGRTLGEVAG